MITDVISVWLLFEEFYVVILRVSVALNNSPRLFAAHLSNSGDGSRSSGMKTI